MDNQYSIGKILYVISLFVFFAAFAVTGKSAAVGDALLVAFFATILLGGCFYLLIRKNVSISAAMQATITFSFLFVFWGCTLYKCDFWGAKINGPVAYSGIAAFFINVLIWVYILFSHRAIQVIRLIWKTIINNWYVIIAIAVFIFFYKDCLSYLFKSDSYIYYSAIRYESGLWNFSLGTLFRFQLGGHATYGYSLFGFLGHYLMPARGIGIRLINLLIICITICCFNGIIKKIVPSLKTGLRCLVLLMFVCNPVVMGLAQEVSMDMAMGCFFVWFLWSYINRKQLLILFTSLLVCFTKENAIIMLFCFMVGVLAVRVIRMIREKHFRFKEFLQNFDWLVVYSAVIFLVNMVFYNNWHTGDASASSGDMPLIVVNTVRFDIDYILIKLKQLFVMNYQWLFLLIAVVGIILLISKRKQWRILEIKEESAGLIIAFWGYIAFQLLFFTYPHYRYTFPNVVFYTLFAGYILSLINHKIINYIIAGIMSVAFLVQSFVNIDFITNRFSRFADTGNGKILTECYYSADPDNDGCLIFGDEGDMSNEVFRDYVQNNRQYLGFENCFELFMSEINYNKNIGIIISPIYKDPVWGADNWTFSNMFGELDRKNVYWNSYRRQLTNEKSDVPVTFLKYYNLKRQFDKCKEVWYVELPYNPDYDYAGYLSKFNILEEKRIELGQWAFNAYKIELKTVNKK